MAEQGTTDKLFIQAMMGSGLVTGTGSSHATMRKARSISGPGPCPSGLPCHLLRKGRAHPGGRAGRARAMPLPCHHPAQRGEAEASWDRGPLPEAQGDAHVQRVSGVHRVPTCHVPFPVGRPESRTDCDGAAGPDAVNDGKGTSCSLQCAPLKTQNILVGKCVTLLVIIVC